MPVIRLISFSMLATLLSLLVFWLIHYLLRLDSIPETPPQIRRHKIAITPVAPQRSRSTRQNLPPKAPAAIKPLPSKLPLPKFPKLPVISPQAVSTITLPTPKILPLHYKEAAINLPQVSNNNQVAIPAPQSKNKTAKASNALVPLKRIEPRYPRRARRNNIEGWVLTEIEITAQGKVSKVKIIDFAPTDIFNRAVQKALLQWRFSPDPQHFARKAQQRLEFSLD